MKAARKGRQLTMIQVNVPTGEVQCPSEPEVCVFGEWVAGAWIDPRPREPKVNQMEPPCMFVGPEHEVARLDVAVDNASFVDMFNDVQLWRTRR